MLFGDSEIGCKRVVIVFSAMLFLLFIVGSVCASENVTNDMNVSDSYDVENDSDYELTENQSDEDNSTLNYENERVYESTHVKYSHSCQRFTSGIIEYKVGFYDLVRYDGVRYIEPKYGSPLKLRVYTGYHYKDYLASVSNDGVAHFKIPNLSIGLHKVVIYHNNVKKGTSSIRIIKSAAKVYAPPKVMKYSKNAYYNIRVIDSHGNAAKNAFLRVNVFTTNKTKTHLICTNYYGFAKIRISELSAGVNRIIIKTADSRYAFYKTTKVVVNASVLKTPERIYAIAPAGTNQYNADAYFRITVKDCYYSAVKNLVLKVKVFTGGKYKTVTLKTNSNGIASYNTKSLSIGVHRIYISTANKNYKLNRYSQVIIKRNVQSNTLEPTKLKQLNYYPNGNDSYIKLTWMSKPGSTYQILKKSDGNYRIVSKVIAKSANQIFIEKADNKTFTTYSVRELIADGNKHIVGPWDKEGLKMINSTNIDVDFQNLKAEISWNKVVGATHYKIFRKIGSEGKYQCIATVGSKALKYIDWYYKSSKELSQLLKADVFIDPSINKLFYTVRACNIQKVSNIQKSSWGFFLNDGVFHLEAPTIVYLKQNNITWGEVPNAKGYNILKRDYESESWEIIAEANNTNSLTQSLEIGEIDEYAYYSVQAFSIRNGEMIYSDFDKGFTLRYFSQDNSTNKILFIGDSITYGSPYLTKSDRHIFSFPHRISQLTGSTIYNPSVPRSTYHDLGTNPDGSNVESGNIYRYRIPREVVDPISTGQCPVRSDSLDTANNSAGISNTTISDYDIVVLSAGVNDYIDSSRLGTINTTNTYYFNGGINHVMNKIENASRYRVSQGLSPIKVVFVDLFYSDFKYPFYKTVNLDKTPNSVGLTLADYQKELNKQFVKWSGSDLELFKFKTRSYGIVNAANCKYTTADNLHFTKFTYGQYGNALAQFLVENVFE